MNLFRTFVCIDFFDSVINEIARIQEILRKLKFVGKLTELENLHLTLKFLGNISDKKIQIIKKKLEKIRFSEFDVMIENIGIFSYKGKPKIVWIKIGGEGIFNLQKKVDESLLSDGYEKENRFMSHVTIARVKYIKDVRKFKNYVEKIKLKKIKTKINHFKLKVSELKKNGPVYTTICLYNQNKI